MNKADISFFDEMAPKWDEISEAIPEKIRHILDVAQIANCQEVLDVGTGTGVLIPYIIALAGKNVKIDAVDISAGMLNQANLKFGSLANVNFQLKDIELEQMDKKYDCIMMYCMYPHLTMPIDTVEWLSKLNLKPNGRLVIAFPESKDSINAIHHHNDGSVHSTKLCAATDLKAIFEAKSLNVDYAEDTEDFYIIRITKTT